MTFGKISPKTNNITVDRITTSQGCIPAATKKTTAIEEKATFPALLPIRLVMMNLSLCGKKIFRHLATSPFFSRHIISLTRSIVINTVSLALQKALNASASANIKISIASSDFSANQFIIKLSPANIFSLQ